MSKKSPLRPVPPPDGYVRMVRRRTPSRAYACRVCSHPIARDSVYEFCRAKEVFETTNISYNKFLTQYVEGVIGFPINYQSFMTHVNNHVRPALRREMREVEIERNRVDDMEWKPPDLSDFLVSSKDGAPLPYEHSGRPPAVIANDKGLEPTEDLDPVTHPEFDDVPKKDWDPEVDQCASTYARFWREQGDDKMQKEDE